MGRDAFVEYLRDQGLMIRRRRTRKTTNSNHHFKKHQNLILEFKPEKPNQLWVSDITYIETQEGVVYLSLITDAFSRKIVGWCVGETLEAIYPLKALDDALENETFIANELIHHSDRGVQYCCHKYVEKLHDHGIRISMTQSGDPLENALAERMNGILKTEWLYHTTLKDLNHAKMYIKQIIDFYNTERPHMSIGNKTPQEVHRKALLTKKMWNNFNEKKKNVS